MDEVVPRLWIGDLPSALDVEGLKEKKIFSIVTAMRGKVTIHAAFNKYQINIDDSSDEDVLVHFMPSISFIQNELDKGRGVLVHCQAGISRSATIIAAYLMHALKLDPTIALDMIKKVRPNIEPNEGFMQQLEVFHQASCQFTPRDKAIRMFYMERTVEEIMNGDGTMPAVDMFAKYPRSASNSTPATPKVAPSRRIRCKMCRQELATREHMLDHGQVGPPTPALPSLSPVSSRRPSMNDHAQTPHMSPLSRRPSASLTVSISRHPSFSQSRSRPNSTSRPNVDGRPAGLAGLGGRGLLESLSMSALETDDDPESDDIGSGENVVANSHRDSSSRRPSGGDVRPLRPSPLSIDNIGKEISNALEVGVTSTPTVEENAFEPARALSPVKEAVSGASREVAPAPPPPPPAPSTQYASPSDLAAQLHSHPKLAALRSPPGLGMTPLHVGKANLSPPILMNPKCSGYFVEPMKWMEPFLEAGQLAGKIICPNKKCNAKLGNYDWAGVCCGCKEWVTPGFCIHRSKVDEVLV
ncbi:hypothetical protein BJ138DRAFT_1059286 [Hygrophoropsis aurantiaca]|uniref:Uncharacterized protein n=1 Tax=Hygrophoropsis aurantiaca TaxID=72124 RepID=A0ACB8AIU8_9AGAM|nr:hypothetical protein BJ138DRAFT_1059286 [Hygrophoropsis aurantiaca]